MSKRDSGYARVKRDHYPTPAWVIDALCEVIDLKNKTIWEPACGTGQMAEAIKLQGGNVRATDVHLYPRAVAKLGLRKFDFLNGGNPGFKLYDGIVTNPPYGERGKLAEAFIESGLRRMKADYGGFLALLLPADFDHAKSRARFFAECPRFAGVITLTRRIKWFDRPTASGKMHGPKDNHNWYLWRAFEAETPPRVWYAPRQTVVSVAHAATGTQLAEVA